MKLAETYLKEKLIKNTIKNGKKHTVEKNITKCFKKIQLGLNKKLKDIIKLSIRNSTPLFKLHKFEIKKGKRKKLREVPGFILYKISRNSAAIKNMLINIKTGKKKLKDNLQKELILNAKNNSESNSISKKIELNSKISSYSHLFKYFKLH